jgi:hypothetical protein
VTGRDSSGSWRYTSVPKQPLHRLLNLGHQAIHLGQHVAGEALLLSVKADPEYALPVP